MGVVLEIVIFRWDNGVDEEDARVNRRVNKRSDFVGLIERTVAMSGIWLINRVTLKFFDIEKERKKNRKSNDSKWHLKVFLD
jgi:hypothetical protein